MLSWQIVSLYKGVMKFWSRDFATVCKCFLFVIWSITRRDGQYRWHIGSNVSVCFENWSSPNFINYVRSDVFTAVTMKSQSQSQSQFATDGRSVSMSWCRLLGYKNPVPTSQETHYVPAIETSRLMLCRVTVFHCGDYEECRVLICDAVWLM
jgi:hypothetical protein